MVCTDPFAGETAHAVTDLGFRIIAHEDARGWWWRVGARGLGGEERRGEKQVEGQGGVQV